MPIDLTAAVEAARDEMDDWETFRADDGHLSIGMKDRKRTAAEVVARIAPLIEQAVREQVAQDIETLRLIVVRDLPKLADFEYLHATYSAPSLAALNAAAKIAMNTL